MADPSIPRYEDYVGPDGRLKQLPQRGPLTMRERARRLIRDIPVAADSLNAFPGGAVAAAPLRLAGRGLSRMTAGGARLVDGPAANPVLRGAYEVVPTVPDARGTGELALHTGRLAALNLATKTGASIAGRNVTFKDKEKKGLER